MVLPNHSTPHGDLPTFPPRQETALSRRQYKAQVASAVRATAGTAQICRFDGDPMATPKHGVFLLILGILGVHLRAWYIQDDGEDDELWNVMNEAVFVGPQRAFKTDRWCLTSFDRSPSGFLFRFFSAIVKGESDSVRFMIALEVAMLESLL